jgi:hypothetical protein
METRRPARPRPASGAVSLQTIRRGADGAVRAQRAQAASSLDRWLVYLSTSFDGMIPWTHVVKHRTLAVVYRLTA